jgi:5-methylcytosine-specific restriction protein B
MANQESTINSEYKKFRDEGKIEFVTFHPSYSYEEFIEGITVKVNDNNMGEAQYLLKEGIFKKLCTRALAKAINPPIEIKEETTWNHVYNKYKKAKEEGNIDFTNAPKFVLIIDEINRGDIAKIFGELITLLEADKRLGATNEIIAKLPTSTDGFGVPPNVYIIGTMNTADRSIALLDVALRRRFGFIEMNPNFEVLETWAEDNQTELEDETRQLLSKSIEKVKRINADLCKDNAIGRDRQIGHSFLFNAENMNDLKLVWRYEILPLLEEYCYSDYKKVNELLFGSKTDSEWITETEGIKEIEDLDMFLDAIK